VGSIFRVLSEKAPKAHDNHAAGKVKIKNNKKSAKCQTKKGDERKREDQIVRNPPKQKPRRENRGGGGDFCQKRILSRP